MTKYILFFIGCCILFAPLRSQNVEPIKFVHIGLNEGLSQSTIFGITQDKQGNMWFATYNGLNKYNGYDFTVYQHDEHNPHSISNDIIRSCTADRLGKIWIGTDSGLSFYNADKDRFENFSSEDNHDFLEVRAGPQHSSALIGQFTGSQIPPPLLSTTHLTIIHFYSDHSENRPGFKLNYQGEFMCDF